jgi:lactose/L-arabinose transport system substrate-binding protein
MNSAVRSWLVWIPLLCCGVLLAAWLLRANPEANRASQPPAEIPPDRLRGAITVWSWNIAAKSLQGLLPTFERDYPHVRVAVDMTGARMETRVMLSLASGVGAPDVSQFQMRDAPRYIATGKLTDLTPVAAKYRTLFPASLWDNCTLNGRVYAIPWDMGPCAVYYQRDIFQRYAIDPSKIETWDDYIEAGRQILQKSGGRAKMLPLGANALGMMFEILIQQNGGQVFDDQGRIAINSPQTRQALEIIRRMRAAGIGSDIPLWSQEFLAGLSDESIATYPSAVWFAGTMKDTVKDFADKKAAWGVFKLPALEKGGLRVANYGGSVLVIPDQCRNKAAAWAFIEYALCTREGQIAQYKSMSLFPAFLPALESSILDEADPFFGGQRIGRLFATDVTKISRVNRTPAWGEASRYLDQALSQWAASGMPTEGFFETLETKLHRRLGLEISPQSLSTPKKSSRAGTPAPPWRPATAIAKAEYRLHAVTPAPPIPLRGQAEMPALLRNAPFLVGRASVPAIRNAGRSAAR